MTRVLACIAVLCLASSCSRDAARPPLAVADAAPSPRLWLRPPSGDVRAYPPHAIRSDGVGPYIVGSSLSDVLHVLPDGPRVEILEVGAIVDWRVVRAEGGALLIGADGRNRVAFVAVLAPEIARTESGIGVGSSGAELLRALGDELDGADVSIDRRTHEFAALLGVRFVTDAPLERPSDAAHVIAVIVAKPDASARGPSSRASCRAGGTLAGARVELGAALHPGGRASAASAQSVRFGCFSSATPEAVVVGKDELSVFGGEPGRLRRLAHLALEGAPSVVPVDLDDDGRDELLIGTPRRDGDRLAEDVRIARWEAGHLVELQSERILEVTAAAAAAAGVTPAAVDFALVARGGHGAVTLGGLYFTHSGGRIGEMAPIAPVVLRLVGHRTPLAVEEVASDEDAGLHETGTQP